MVGEGVREILRELEGRRRCGDTTGGILTSVERALARGLIAFDGARFVLTESGMREVARIGPKEKREAWRRDSVPEFAG